MSSQNLAPEERAILNDIIEDLRLIFDKREILPDELGEILQSLRSEEVKSEAFFAGRSILGKYIYGTASPEVREDGFVDYLIRDENGRLIVLELKPLFEAEIVYDKARKPVLKKLRQRKLDWKAHKAQIAKYIQDSEYVILTNLKEWVFFGRSSNLADLKPFYTVELFQFIKEYEVIGNLKDYADRKEFQSIRYDLLTKEFFENLERWVEKLSEVEFTVDDKRKLELIINLINKFIFIQTLDDYGVIEFKWIMKTWNHHESRWHSKGKLEVLRRFFDEVDSWFYLYYDTELFKEDILAYVKTDEKNIDTLYRNLSLVLGLAYWKSPLGGFKGIMQYNFRQIDEDVLGKAYETFLAEQRKEEGAFYTPKYITEYIVENTLGKLCDGILKEAEKAVKAEDLNKLEELVERLTSIKVLDPACGSGSFLIKALRRLYRTYTKFLELVRRLESKNDKWTSLVRPPEVESKVERINKILKVLAGNGKRDLISKLLIRHIHGVDLDRRALEVAKVNLWLEALKLAPQEFRYDRLPRDTNHILPDLEMNLCNGDSIVGLPENIAIEFLAKKHKDDIVRLHILREKYLDNPTNPKLVERIEEIKNKLRKELNEEFKKWLNDRKLFLKIFNKTKPFHWALEFWYVFFGKDGNPLPKEKAGFDVVIGNPPYFTIRGKGAGTLKQTFYYEYLQKSEKWKEVFRSHSDMYYYFTILSANILREEGRFGFIIENYWLENDYADKMRETLISKTKLNTLIHFGNIKIFDDAQNDTCILLFQRELDKEKRENNDLKVIFCKKTFPGRTKYEQNSKLIQHISNNFDKTSYHDAYIDIFLINQKKLGTGKWILSTKIKILNKLKKDGIRISPLGDLNKNIKEKFPDEFIDNKGKELVGVAIIAQGMSPGVKKIFSLSPDIIRKLKIEKEVLRPLVTNSDISKYFLPITSRKIIYPRCIKDLKKYPNLKKYLEKHKDELLKGPDRKKLLKQGKIRWFDYNVYRNYEIFENEKIKILCPYRAEENTFALDELGYFGTTDIYAIVPKKDRKINIKFLLGVLNSKLLTFWYAEAGKRKGIMLEYFTTPLKRIPIRVVALEQQKPLIELVDKIIMLKKVHYKLLKFWKEWSIKLKNAEISLLNILIQDRENMRAGKFEKCWTSNVTFFPDGKQEIMNKEFCEFKVRGDVQAPILEIYGVNENNEEELIYQIEFNKRDLMLHVYLSILTLLESRRKVKSLSDLLKKTTIPIVKPDVVKNTANIMKKVEEEFKKSLKGEKSLTCDIVAVDNEIEDIEAQIDALVFKLYGLNEEEINIVAQSLHLTPSYQQKILDEFRKLKD